VLDALDRVRGEFNAACLCVALDERIEARLVDGDLSAVQALDLARIDIHANDMVARISEACPRDEADVSRAENGYTHSGKFLSDKEE
jgi:hypothetical protein